MIRNYFWVIHTTIQKIIIGNIQPAQDDPETSSEGSPKCPNIRDPQGTLREPIQKLMILWKNCFFRSNSHCVTYLFLFLEEEQIFKSSKRGRPRDVYGTQLLDVHGTKWWDILRTTVRHWSNIFLN